MKNTKKAIQYGFSLVEMLVVIAVIGIIAAIAVPNIGRINDSAKDAKNRRNAQNIASVYASASAAGYDFLDPGATGAATETLEAAVAAICGEGVTINDPGPFDGTFFGVPNVGSDEQANAIKYLDKTHNMIVYVGL